MYRFDAEPLSWNNKLKLSTNFTTEFAKVDDVSCGHVVQ